jgi:small subunit ribosomal protein S16
MNTKNIFFSILNILKKFKLMLKLRLKRCGRKKQPFYKIVVMENTSRRDGYAIEELGCFNPIDKTLKINRKRVITRLEQGVKPTETLISLLKQANILTILS